MTKTTKNKYVRQEVLYDYVLPEDDEQVVKVKRGRGNNLHEVETASGEVFLASMPSKFRRVIWIKRGDFVIVKPIKEGVKVKAEITHILLKGQINYIKEEGRWPVGFDSSKENTGDSLVIDPEKSVVQEKKGSLDDELLANTNRQIIECEDTESSDEESSDEDLFVNTNRQIVECEDTESSDEESSDEDLFVNTNRQIVECEDTESSDEESSDEDLFVNANRQAATLEKGTEPPVES